MNQERGKFTGILEGESEEVKIINSERRKTGRERLEEEALRLKYGAVSQEELSVQRTESARNIAVRDFSSLIENVELDVTSNIEPLLLMRTVQGHANSGHCEFQGRMFPNFTIDDSVRFNLHTLNQLLRGNNYPLSFDDIKVKCQKVIDDIVGVVDDLIEGKDVRCLVNSSGEPLAGANFLLNERIDDEGQDPLDVVRGIYLASRMDNYLNWRKKVEKKYRFKMGGGICCAVNIPELEKRGFDLGYLSSNEFELEGLEGVLMDFQEEGIVVLNEDIESNNGYSNGYVRMRAGRGISDDCAVINAGFLYSRNHARGVFLGDAIDTWGTFAPILYAGGQDERLGDYIKQRADAGCFELRLTDEEVIDFIYLSAINPDPELSEKYPDSSQRYFLQKWTGGLSAISSHFSFIKQLRREIDTNQRCRAIKTRTIPLSFSRVKSTDFYCNVVRPKIIGYLKEHNLLGHGLYKESN